MQESCDHFFSSFFVMLHRFLSSVLFLWSSSVLRGSSSTVSERRNSPVHIIRLHNSLYHLLSFVLSLASKACILPCFDNLSVCLTAKRRQTQTSATSSAAAPENQKKDTLIVVKEEPNVSSNAKDRPKLKFDAGVKLFAEVTDDGC